MQPASIPSRAVIKAERLWKRYGDRAVLQDVSLNVFAGERLALTGQSGSGKTTLLNCLGGVDRADQGSLHLREEPLHDLSSEALAHVRRHHVGTIFQFFHLLPTLSAFENVELPLQLIGAPAEERHRRVTVALERIGLSHRKDAMPSQLSGGEQQRVAVARALIHAPAVLLADEPTGNLDTANGQIVLQLLRELTDETKTALILVTHSEDAASVCHRRIHLRDGRIVDGG